MKSYNTIKDNAGTTLGKVDTDRKKDTKETNTLKAQSFL